jgi:hypothetical protein
MDYDFRYFAYDSILVPAQIASGFGPDKAFSTQELLQLGIRLFNEEGSYKFFEMDERALFGQLLNENKQSFINLDTGRVNFLDGNFTGLLNSVMAYAEQGYISKHVSPQQSAEQRLKDDLAAVQSRRYFKLSVSFGLVYQFMRNFPASMKLPGIEEYYSDIINDEVACIRANADGSVPFTYFQGFCMNNQSKNKAAVWAFIKYLLSKEMQTSGSLGLGLGINNEARAEGAEHRLFGSRFEVFRTALSSQQRQALEELVEEYKAVVEKLSDSINTFIIQDESLNDMIDAELQYYFFGTRSADEIARVLQNRAALYLSE